MTLPPGLRSKLRLLTPSNGCNAVPLKQTAGRHPIGKTASVHTFKERGQSCSLGCCSRKSLLYFFLRGSESFWLPVNAARRRSANGPSDGCLGRHANAVPS